MSAASVSSTMPIELIDHIFKFVDNSSLFQLCRCSRLFHALAFPRLTSQHMSRSRIRLWIEQPGLTGHKPMDFEWLDYDKERGKLVFKAKSINNTEQQCFTFNTSSNDSIVSTPPIIIDGLTVLLPPSSDTEVRRIYSISYNNNNTESSMIPALSIHNRGQDDNKNDEMLYNTLIYPGKTNQHQQRTAYSCAWQLKYQITEQTSSCIIMPKNFECDLDLLNPHVLEKRQNKKTSITKPFYNDTTILVPHWRPVSLTD